MSDTKFTPGPWSFCGAERGGCPCYSIGASDHPIAHIEHGEWGDEYCNIRLVDSPSGIGKMAEAFMDHCWYGEITEEAAKANANLIAAAPELYASLKEMLGWCIWDTEYAARARAALAKAEGRQA